MGTQIPGYNGDRRGRRQEELRELRDGRGKSAPDDPESGHAAELLSLAQDQMLVNQALVEKIFALEQAEEALRASEQKLHRLLAHQLAIREDERKRISQELHDSLGQNLLALRIDIVLLHQHTTNRHYRLRDRIGSALDNVDITLRTVKELLGELRPSGLELGLHATVEMELRKFTRASGIACELAGAPGIAELVMGEEELLTVYRVLQECLNNVFRHSLASRVHVELHTVAGILTMRIVDNGIGFDPDAPRKPGSFGLLDLHERVSGHGGKLIVKSARPHGTEVTLSIPTAPTGSNASGLHAIG
jgi:signal transduction histidine kinase